MWTFFGSGLAEFVYDDFGGVTADNAVLAYDDAFARDFRT